MKKIRLIYDIFDHEITTREQIRNKIPMKWNEIKSISKVLDNKLSKQQLQQQQKIPPIIYFIIFNS